MQPILWVVDLHIVTRANSKSIMFAITHQGTWFIFLYLIKKYLYILSSFPNQIYSCSINSIRSSYIIHWWFFSVCEVILTHSQSENVARRVLIGVEMENVVFIHNSVSLWIRYIKRLNYFVLTILMTIIIWTKTKG